MKKVDKENWFGREERAYRRDITVLINSRRRAIFAKFMLAQLVKKFS
jgi:hypothetical protein